MIRHVAITDFPATQDQRPDTVVWDVRDAKAYAEGHIEGAVNKPIETLDAAVLTDIPPGKTIHILCGGGTKAGRAVELLESIDPSRDYVELEGGTRGARTAGYPIVTDER